MKPDFVKPHQDELMAESLQTTQGIPINIRGQIDRIDTYTEDDQSYVNIIDYKSSKVQS